MNYRVGVVTRQVRLFASTDHWSKAGLRRADGRGADYGQRPWKSTVYSSIRQIRVLFAWQSGWQGGGLLAEAVEECGVQQYKTDPCAFRVVVQGKVELIIVDHVDAIVMAGTDETCRDFHAALVTKFPTINLGEQTWYTGYAFKHDWKMWVLEITQKMFIDN